MVISAAYDDRMIGDRWAAALGVHVVEELLPGSAVGYFDHRTNTIYLDSRLSPIQRRSTLMHELGHAYYGHTACTPRWEREASEWAAAELVNEAEFVAAAYLYEGSIAVAHELGVLPRDVDNYARLRVK